jgi:transcriptional regulator with XRE-family HTH domain
VARGTHDPRYRRLISALAAARRRSGLTQVELADRLGKRQQYVSKFESYERRLDIVEFVDISRALELDLHALLKEIPPA